MMMKRITFSLVACFATLCLSAGSAHADMWLALNDLPLGPPPVLIKDGGVGDLAAGVAGQILYSGAIGPWAITVTTGISKPAIGVPGVTAEMHLDNVSITSTSTAGGQLTLYLTDTDFTVPPGMQSLVSSYGGVAGGTIELWQVLDPDDTEFAHYNPYSPAVDPDPDLAAGNNLVLYSGLLGPGPFAGLKGGSIDTTGPFSLTEKVVITHTGPGITSFDIHSVVPVPGAVLLGILGMGVAGWKLRKFA